MCSSVGMTVGEMIERLQEFELARGFANVYIETDSNYIPIDRIEIKEDYIVLITVGGIQEKAPQPWEDPEEIEDAA